MSIIYKKIVSIPYALSWCSLCRFFVRRDGTQSLRIFSHLTSLTYWYFSNFQSTLIRKNKINESETKYISLGHHFTSNSKTIIFSIWFTLRSISKTFKCQRPFSFINMLVRYESKRICALAWLHKNCINQYSLRIRKFLTDSVLMK